MESFVTLLMHTFDSMNGENRDMLIADTSNLPGT